MTITGDVQPLAGAAVPAEVRRAGPQAERRYAAALSFERALLAELTERLCAGALGDGESTSAATAVYRDALPGTLADALARAGGIGLARGLYESLDGAP